MKEGDIGWRKAMYGIDDDFPHDCNLYLATIENTGSRGGIKNPSYTVIRGDLLPVSERVIGDLLFRPEVWK